jgi:DNA polymerase-1
MHQGSLALAEVEAAGMRIDVDRLDRTIEEIKNRIEKLTEELKQDEVYKVWKDRYGKKTNLSSRQQLGKVLFDELAYQPTALTKTGRPKTDEAALEAVDHQFVRDYLTIEKLKKLHTTYLLGIRREVVGEYLRAMFNLHTTKTFRSSSDRPNFQNFPIRDPEIGRLIRSCFITRDDHVLVEVDYSALEFRVCACHWKDPAMVAYASDSSLDIHRDIAAECYMLDDVPKSARFYAKNQFVFPILYGSYYISCAKNLWSVIETGNLETSDGVGLYDHLKSQGIRKLGLCDSRVPPRRGTFEYHIKQVENDFNDKFPKWSTKKDVWWSDYLRKGSFRTMTGFECKGVFSRNDLYNWPIQGPAFHLLLWSLIQMVKWIRKKKMKSRIVGQIHDSLVADIHVDELDDYLAKVKQVMTEDVREAWDWVIVPLEIEAEIAETNWFEKKEVIV